MDPTTCTIGQFKERVSAQCGVPPARQKIFGLPPNNLALLSRVKPTDGQQFLLWRTKVNLFNAPSASSAPETAEESLWDAMPIEVQYMILGLLDLRTLLQCSSVSRAWQEMSQNDWVWDEKIAERWDTFDSPTFLPGVSSASHYAEMHRIEKNWTRNVFTAQRASSGTSAIAMDSRNYGYLALCGEASLDADDASETSEEHFRHAYDRIREDSMVALASGSIPVVEVGNVWKKEMRKTLRGHHDLACSVAFAGIHSLISGDALGNLILWDLYRSDAPLPWSTTSSEFVGKRQLGRVSVTALSVFGSQVLFGNANGDLGFLDVDRGMYPLQMLPSAHSRAITKFAQSRSDPTLVASSSASSPVVKLWDSRSGVSTTSLFADTSSVRTLQFGFDNQLVTGGVDGVRLWDLRMSVPLYLVPQVEDVSGLSYDGSRLVVGCPSQLMVAQLGSRGVPDPNADIDEFKAQKENEKLRRQAGDVLEEDTINPAKHSIRLAAPTFIFCPSPSHLVCLSSGVLTGLDFSYKPKITRRQADSSYDPEDDYIPSPSRSD